MHDVRVTFDDEFVGDLDAAGLGHATDVIATQVEQHQMLGTFFGVGQQFGCQGFVLHDCRTTFARPRNRPQGDAALAFYAMFVIIEADQNLR